MDSPPSPPSPPTPPEVMEAIIREKLRLEQERRQKEQFIALVISYLKKFSHKDSFIASLSSIIQNHSSFEKRYQIANVINNTMAGQDIDKEDVRANIRMGWANDVFNSCSLLYKRLNYQNTPLLPFTFFGDMSRISYNYSRSLQKVQFILKNGQNVASRKKSGKMSETELEDIAVKTAFTSKTVPEEKQEQEHSNKKRVR